LSIPPLGILGGTFNPIHFGHLRMAQELGEGLDLAEVRLIPAGTPPHRDQPDISAQQRLEMVRLGLSGNPLLQLDEREIFKQTPCYTLETLAELRRELGWKQPLCLLMGADAFWGLPTWYHWRELFDLAHIVVAHRPDFSGEGQSAGFPSELHEELEKRLRHDVKALHQSPAGMIVNHPVTALDISSTRIRALLRQGLSPRYLLPDTVLDYIFANNLYL
jgi:nicotinate-nucleotide adenylyltransferase